jgi:hypothetical protein
MKYIIVEIILDDNYVKSISYVAQFTKALQAIEFVREQDKKHRYNYHVLEIPK